MENEKYYTGRGKNNIQNIVYLNNLILKTIKEIRIQKVFIWNNFTLKIKHETLCNSFEDGLKNVDKIRKSQVFNVHGLTII